MRAKITTAMVLAAGLGKRMRAHDDTLPKPLVTVSGKALIDYTLDRLARADVRTAVVNTHHMGHMIEVHLAGRTQPEIIISREESEPLETGGGLIKATEYFPNAPIFCTNTDAILLDKQNEAWTMLSAAWVDEEMDALLLLCPVSAASGYEGTGDFLLNQSGQISWPDDGEQERFVFTGLQIIHPRLFANEELRKVSTRVFWEKAMQAGRMCGVVYHGRWMHVGDPEGVRAAEVELKGHR